MLNLDNLKNALPTEVTVTAIQRNISEGGPQGQNLDIPLGAPSYFDLKINDPTNILNGSFDSYCIDFETILEPVGLDYNGDGDTDDQNVNLPTLGVDANEVAPEDFSASVYSSYDTSIYDQLTDRGVQNPENLATVNWLINNQDTFIDQGFTAADIQTAIWELVDSPSTISEAFRNYATDMFGGINDDNVAAIVAEANNNADFVPQAGEKVAVILVPPGNNQIIIAGVELSTFKGSIGDTIFRDDNADGVQDAGEEGIENVTVELIDKGADGELGGGDDTVIETQTTDANGEYLFEDLPTGNYAVVVTDENNALDGLDQTADPDAELDNMSMVELAPGENNLDQDFGYDAPTGSIGDTIFRDDNADGDQDAGEEGISGVEVRLTDKGDDGVFGTDDDVVIGTETTDADGKYLFDGLDAGNYQVEVLNNNGALDGLDQTADPDGTLDNGSMVELAQGEDNLDQDFGYDAPTGSIGDTIFRDDNADGDQDAGEEGISGVEVRLTDKGDDGVFGTDDDVVIGTETTDADGKYLFDGLDAGNYQVEVLNNNGALDGLDQTADPDGTLDNGSMVELAQGEDNLDQDFGYDAPTGSIGDTIFRDDNADGDQDDGEA
ncbi:SdrD B-like domain-containing protein, partial [Dapis sp. BLCC M126]|uniref:SdrD B-like domain-containing protein n=1 Tax=Dapis sp. BLCC M126 TaxID=3400189 RepID=UPI003CF8E823